MMSGQRKYGIYTQQNIAHLERNKKNMKFECKLMELEIITLSEVAHTQVDKC